MEIHDRIRPQDQKISPNTNPENEKNNKYEKHLSTSFLWECNSRFDTYFFG